MIERYPDQVEGLEALGGAVSCYAAFGKPNNGQQPLPQIRQLLPKMPPEIRKAWAAWLEEAEAAATGRQADHRRADGAKEVDRAEVDRAEVDSRQSSVDSS